jgi:hypothetical protein
MRTVERHHLFPRGYLQKLGVSGTRIVNQIANYSYVEWPDNIEISDLAPQNYWPQYQAQFRPQDLFHHALPDGWHLMPYEEFLDERRRLIAQVIRSGFESIGATPDASAGTRTGPLLVPEAIEDTYLHPDRPFSNELAIRRVVRQLRGTVLWYEQHLDRKALEILTDELVVDQVDDLRLMSGPANLNSKTKRDFTRFAAELDAKGVPCQWRVLRADKARSIHARVIADDSRTFEVPPLSFVLAAGGVDSIRASDIPMETFHDAWEHDSIPLLDYETHS